MSQRISILVALDVADEARIRQPGWPVCAWWV
uniref:Uncharacterized protein n=1 Tax=Ralstonia solanacearum TaxID=305 RepID=A0A0S4XCL7_RALSL|nr:protein of unknown function [Ralstonia solanacearum]CUV33785.1 protein of unknown function [Ralstonia solanacearum]CUV41168.1 protein of unknown function [Ralstonia solanacearum]CUV61070.1 protein of unknown function [Ralstonia solanacearum]